MTAMDGNVDLCRLILNNKLDDCNPKSEMGKTSLHFAVTNGHIKVFQLIIERVEDKNPADDNGWTPLHM